MAGANSASRHPTRVDRVLHALNHPLRRQIIQALTYENGSARSLSGDFGRKLSVVSHHLNKVLAKECEVVELVEEVSRRGATEKIYGLRSEAFLGVLDSSLPRELAGLMLVNPGKPPSAANDGRTFAWSHLQLDRDAWGQIQEAQAEHFRRIAGVIRQSRQRTDADEHELLDVIVGAAAFPFTAEAGPRR